MTEIKTRFRTISQNHPTYIIAEIGSNFDRNLMKAKYMVDLAKEAGADCAKFQSFLPDKIVSKSGFDKMHLSFQSKWKKSVYEVYQDAVLPREWHQKIMDHCKRRKMDFSSAPYDIEAVDLLESLHIPFYKIGSGEVSNLEFIRYVAKKNLPMFIGVGASTLGDIEDMINTIKSTGNSKVVLMQCVTNYPSPFEDANINALKTLQSAFGMMTGYSDHTPGHTVPLGAIALGAKIIEKHFTDNKNNSGPDHPFALNPMEFQTMVNEIRNLEKALGSGIKTIYTSEQETKILQRRSLYSAIKIKKGDKIKEHMITLLRPAKGLSPKFKSIFIGKIAQIDLPEDHLIDWDLITLSAK